MFSMLRFNVSYYGNKIAIIYWNYDQNKLIIFAYQRRGFFTKKKQKKNQDPVTEK